MWYTGPAGVDFTCVTLGVPEWAERKGFGVGGGSGEGEGGEQEENPAYRPAAKWGIQLTKLTA